MARKGGKPISQMVARLVELGTEMLVRDLGLTPESARLAMRQIAHELCQEWGGTMLYVAKDIDWAKEARDVELWKAFTGNNHNDLARQFGVSVSQVYTVLRYMRGLAASQQQELELEAPADPEGT